MKPKEAHWCPWCVTRRNATEAEIRFRSGRPLSHLFVCPPAGHQGNHGTDPTSAQGPFNNCGHASSCPDAPGASVGSDRRVSVGTDQEVLQKSPRPRRPHVGRDGPSACARDLRPVEVSVRDRHKEGFGSPCSVSGPHYKHSSRSARRGRREILVPANSGFLTSILRERSVQEPFPLVRRGDGARFIAPKDPIPRPSNEVIHQVRHPARQHPKHQQHPPHRPQLR